MYYFVVYLRYMYKQAIFTIELYYTKAEAEEAAAACEDAETFTKVYKEGLTYEKNR